MFAYLQVVKSQVQQKQRATERAEGKDSRGNSLSYLSLLRRRRVSYLKIKKKTKGF
jgi:hypothetical protein